MTMTMKLLKRKKYRKERIIKAASKQIANGLSQLMTNEWTRFLKRQVFSFIRNKPSFILKIRFNYSWDLISFYYKYFQIAIVLFFVYDLHIGAECMLFYSNFISSKIESDTKLNLIKEKARRRNWSNERERERASKSIKLLILITISIRILFERMLFMLHLFISFYFMFIINGIWNNNNNDKKNKNVSFFFFI